MPKFELLSGPERRRLRRARSSRGGGLEECSCPGRFIAGARSYAAAPGSPQCGDGGCRLRGRALSRGSGDMSAGFTSGASRRVMSATLAGSLPRSHLLTIEGERSDAPAAKRGREVLAAVEEGALFSHRIARLITAARELRRCGLHLLRRPASDPPRLALAYCSSDGRFLVTVRRAPKPHVQSSRDFGSPGPKVGAHV